MAAAYPLRNPHLASALGLLHGLSMPLLPHTVHPSTISDTCSTSPPPLPSTAPHLPTPLPSIPSLSVWRLADSWIPCHAHAHPQTLACDTGDSRTPDKPRKIHHTGPLRPRNPKRHISERPRISMLIRTSPLAPEECLKAPTDA